MRFAVAFVSSGRAEKLTSVRVFLKENREIYEVISLLQSDILDVMDRNIQKSKMIIGCLTH